MSAPTTRITAGQRKALKAIAAGSGTFHKLVGNALQRAGLAYPQPVLSELLIGSNCRYAVNWVLTEAGADVIGVRKDA